MVKGSGISTVLKKYAFTDLNPFPGNNYYRLKQIDYDGNFHHSEMIAFNFEPTTLNIEISDNSTTDNVTTLIHGESKQGYILQLYDALGQLVYNNKLHAEIKTNIAVSFLKPGLYFLNVYPVSDISATPSHFLSKKILIN
jgi:hypothetical protein